MPAFHMKLTKEFRSEIQSFETSPQRRLRECLSLARVRLKISKGGGKSNTTRILQETFYFDKKVEGKLLRDSKNI